MKETTLKGERALVLENAVYTATVLPDLGGKIASFYHKPKSFELLFQHKGDTYNRPGLDSDFAQFDASGYDDCFPSITKETFRYVDKRIDCPDHGEIWCSSFDVETPNAYTIRMKMQSRLLPYSYEKTVMLSKRGLCLSYDIQNNGSAPFDCFYTAHLLINCQEDMRIDIPNEVSRIINVLDSRYLGKAGTAHSYPQTTDAYGNVYRLDGVCARTAKKYEKYYVADAVKHGVCGAYYPKDDVTFTMVYDSDVLPYLGFWVTEGGFRGDYNCALEPSGGFYDSIALAKKNKSIMTIAPGKSIRFDIALLLA